MPDYTITKKYGSMKNEEKQERTFTLISLTYLYKNANNQKTKKTSYQWLKIQTINELMHGKL